MNSFIFNLLWELSKLYFLEPNYGYILASDVRQPIMEDNLWWKKTFVERQPFMEDNLWWKMTFDETQPLMEDNLW